MANERFWSKVKKLSDPDACWLWTAGIRKAYGQFWDGNKMVAAHRYSYELAHGHIPEGVFVCHHCDTRNCVRPDHLFLGTPKDNTQDAVAKGRIAHGDSHGTKTKPGSVARGDSHWTRTRPELKPLGEAHAGAKVTEDDVRQIRTMDASMSQEKIAIHFGISPQNIGRILRGETWRHIT